MVCLQVSANGNVLQSEIVGSVKMRCYLSGMPELRLGLNDKVLFENTGSEYNTLIQLYLIHNYKLNYPYCIPLFGFITNRGITLNVYKVYRSTVYLEIDCSSLSQAEWIKCIKNNLDIICILIGLQVCFHSAMKHKNGVSNVV